MNSDSTAEKNEEEEESTLVKTGIPNDEDVLELLNSAYDGWGDRSHFKWRYDQYPDYDPTKHTFHITNGDAVIAFRRTTYKEINHNGKKTSFFILGDTAVSKEYRGKGLYSSLHSETMAYCKNQDVPLVMTFNRRGNLTYKANLKRGWNYRQLPVYLRIFTPTRVLPQYAELALDDKPRIKRLMSLLGGRVVINTDSGRLSVADIVSEDDKHGTRKQLALSVSLSDRAVSALIEQVSNNFTVSALIKRSLKLFVRDEISLIGSVKKNNGSKNESNTDLIIERIDELSDEDLEDVLSLYNRYEVTMRRETIDLEHMLAHPHLIETLLVRKGNTICGFAPLAIHSGSPIKEVRALDLIYKDEQTLEVLINAIEDVARENDADLLAVMSELDLDNKWTNIEKQVIMWDRLSDKGITDAELKESDWHIGFFDIA